MIGEVAEDKPQGRRPVALSAWYGDCLGPGCMVYST